MHSKATPAIDLEGVKDFVVDHKWIAIGAVVIVGGAFLYTRAQAAPVVTSDGGFSIEQSAPMSSGMAPMTSDGSGGMAMAGGGGGGGSAPVDDGSMAAFAQYFFDQGKTYGGATAVQTAPIGGMDPVASAFNLNQLALNYDYSYNMTALKYQSDIAQAGINLSAYLGGLSATSNIIGQYFNLAALLDSNQTSKDINASNNATSLINSFIYSDKSAVVGNIYGPDGQNIGGISLAAAINSGKNGANNGLQGLVNSGVFSNFLSQTGGSAGNTGANVGGYTLTIPSLASLLPFVPTFVPAPIGGSTQPSSYRPELGFDPSQLMMNKNPIETTNTPTQSSNTSPYANSPQTAPTQTNTSDGNGGGTVTIHDPIYTGGGSNMA